MYVYIYVCVCVGVLHPNGKIYLAPMFANTIGVIDTLTDTFSTIK